MNKVRLILALTLILSLLFSITSYAANPITARDYINLGLEAFREEKYDEAIKYFDDAIKLDPKLNEAYMYKAEVLNQLKKYEEGLKCIELAITANPNIIENYLEKGTFLFELNRYEEAIEAFKKGLEGDSQDPAYATDAYYLMAQAYLFLKDTENCLLTLRRGAFLDPEFKEYISICEEFSSLATNRSFIEFMNDERETIRGDFYSADFLYEDFFKDVAFLDASKHMLDSEKQEITSFNSKFSSNITAGNIYNAATAKSYGLSELCPNKEVIIAIGRFIKKMSLIGIRGTYTPQKFEILYTGKIDGQLKAAIVYEKGSLSFAGLSSSESQDYYVYIKNNGVWELYTSLAYMDQNQVNIFR